MFQICLCQNFFFFFTLSLLEHFPHLASLYKAFFYLRKRNSYKVHHNIIYDKQCYHRALKCRVLISGSLVGKLNFSPLVLT